MNLITITAGEVSLEAELFDSETALKIYDALPIEGRAVIWGDEIYFEIPVTILKEENARTDVEVGELGYWPVGHAFCIFFGPTPISKDEKPQAASPVNVFGRIKGDALRFKSVTQGTLVRIEAV
jgi:hypothetical protein